ncbi:DNA-directed RNA polymerase subunit L [Nosema bombycis CQ1]|uniref:DNA-directed RNA polymerase subunit L n=1 Tax=Nosema bombycis (strain CQ1 / CVCC 102059) TaxID=578461 RepID=R0KLQ1_NOSB1|nr:DNA-directed RNA polymerase subunit L [Nosema bombycis CQ1]|eukprot:EOB11561.1 DNA-directed RNA polymerase subunit L [Nosema bombycis CQ1]
MNIYKRKKVKFAVFFIVKMNVKIKINLKEDKISFIFYPLMSNKFIKMVYDKNILNTIEIRVDGETHTLGSSLTDEISRDNRCKFSTYKVEHPMDNHMLMKVCADGSCAVKDLIIETLKNLENNTQDLINQLQ